MSRSHCTSFNSPHLRLVCGFEMTPFNTKVSVSISLSNIVTDLFVPLGASGGGRTPAKLVGGLGLKFKSESRTRLSKATCARAEL